MITATAETLPGLLTLTAVVHEDARGFFFESYNEYEFSRATGLNPRFVQDNHSYSVAHVLRGLHYQVQRPQAKLVRVTTGEIFDVAVDVRRDAPTFGQWEAIRLSATNRLMRWIPAGYAHGFLVLSDGADVFYKTTDYRVPELERAIAWDDPELDIRWPLDGAPILSARDAAASSLRQAELME